jgi:hypothetical protein
VVACPCPSRGASIGDWRADLAEIGRQLRARHPDPFARCGRLTFERALARLEEEVPRLTEEQRVVRAMRLVALVGDGHTQLEPARPDFGRWYPVRVQEFEGGFFITAEHESVVDLAGAEILEVAGGPWQRAAEDARSLLGADNEFGAREGLFAFSSAPSGRGWATPTPRAASGSGCASPAARSPSVGSRRGPPTTPGTHRGIRPSSGTFRPRWEGHRWAAPSAG